MRKWRESLRDLRRLEVEGAIFAVGFGLVVGWLERFGEVWMVELKVRGSGSDRDLGSGLG
jgi:hypothetical protein